MGGGINWVGKTIANHQKTSGLTTGKGEVALKDYQQRQQAKKYLEIEDRAHLNMNNPGRYSPDGKSFHLRGKAKSNYDARPQVPDEVAEEMQYLQKQYGWFKNVKFEKQSEVEYIQEQVALGFAGRGAAFYKVFRKAHIKPVLTKYIRGEYKSGINLTDEIIWHRALTRAPLTTPKTIPKIPLRTDLTKAYKARKFLRKHKDKVFNKFEKPKYELLSGDGYQATHKTEWIKLTEKGATTLPIQRQSAHKLPEQKMQQVKQKVHFKICSHG